MTGADEVLVRSGLDVFIEHGRCPSCFGRMGATLDSVNEAVRLTCTRRRCELVPGTVPSEYFLRLGMLNFSGQLDRAKKLWRAREIFRGERDPE